MKFTCCFIGLILLGSLAKIGLAQVHSGPARSCTAKAELLKDPHHRAPVREAGLKQVQADESGEEVESGADKLCQHDADEHE